jgi:hypothetical protein
VADQLVQLLNQWGYQPIFARRGIAPPRLYTYERTKTGLTMQCRGDLSHYLPEGDRIPRPVPHALFDQISGTVTSSKRAQASAAFLRNALACIGILNSSKLDLGFAGAEAFKFSLADLESNGIEPAALNDVLPKLELHTLPPQLLEDGKVYIAYEYLSAGSVTLERDDAKSFTTKVDAATVNSFVDLGAEGSVRVDNNTRMAFRGKDGSRAAFATKVGRVVEESGKRYLALDDGFASRKPLRSPVIPVRNAVVLMLD